jgi:hypothetical protein
VIPGVHTPAYPYYLGPSRKGWPFFLPIRLVPTRLGIPSCRTHKSAIFTRSRRTEISVPISPAFNLFRLIEKRYIAMLLNLRVVNNLTGNRSHIRYVKYTIPAFLIVFISH